MSRLYDDTLALARDTSIKVNVTKMCREIGKSTKWFYNLKSGSQRNQGVDDLQALHDYLANLRDGQAA